MLPDRVRPNVPAKPRKTTIFANGYKKWQETFLATPTIQTPPLHGGETTRFTNHFQVFFAMHPALPHMRLKPTSNTVHTGFNSSVNTRSMPARSRSTPRTFQPDDTAIASIRAHCPAPISR